MLRKFTILAADGMAGFLDLTMGALIAFVVAQLFGFTPPWWFLPNGSVLGFLPDLDALKMMLLQGAQTAEGDHRLTVMHRPLIMVPVCTISVGVISFAAWLCGMWFGYAAWATTTTLLCLLWHYAHDSAWMGSVSDIHWFWPLTKKGPMPYMDHPVWRETYWLRPTWLSIIEIFLGTAILGYLIQRYTGNLLLTEVIVIALWIGATFVWLTHRQLCRIPS